VTIGTGVQNATRGERDIGKCCDRVDVDIIVRTIVGSIFGIVGRCINLDFIVFLIVFL
jgi:hypothetical protein